MKALQMIAKQIPLRMWTALLVLNSRTPGLKTWGTHPQLTSEKKHSSQCHSWGVLFIL